MEDIFKDFGEIESSRLVRDPHDDRSRGFGFVKFVKVEDAEKAIAEMHEFFLLFFSSILFCFCSHFPLSFFPTINWSFYPFFIPSLLELKQSRS